MLRMQILICKEEILSPQESAELSQLGSITAKKFRDIFQDDDTMSLAHIFTWFVPRWSVMLKR